MKPPVASSRHTRSRSRGRGRRSNSGRKPKRLLGISPLMQGSRGKENQIPLISPEVLREGSTSFLRAHTPPPFNLSFGSDLSDEVLSYMDKLDGRLAVCSTPLSFSLSQHSAKPAVASATPFFDVSNSSGIKEHAIQSTPQESSTCNQSSFLTTPSKDTKNHLQLSHWGLPEKVLAQYAKRGITSMFEWQAECLTRPNVLTGGNLVYSAPTSAGKTLVAELLALKSVLEQRKKVIFILPFVSIAQEKTNYLQQVFEPVGVKVGGFMGNHSPSGGFTAVDIAICTIEKANSLVNRLLEEKSTHQLGAVIVDELHMIGDQHRGYLLELLLTKLMYVCKRGQGSGKVELDPTQLTTESAQTRQNAIQLIGMSATLPNLGTLASWLGAELYHTDFRPVPLREMVKIGPTLYTTDFKKIRDFDKSESFPGDEDDILLICKETVLENHSVLIFCPSKSWCENLASTIARAPFLHTSGDTVGAAHVNLNFGKLVGICEQLRRTQVGLDHILEKTISRGVAFHHAGLTFEEREIVEGAFRQSLIKILVATSTLSSGVNLPARLVIVRTPFFQRSLLDVLVYKQMVGRAGRKGVDEAGESILICKGSERSKVIGLLKSAPKPVQSCLGNSGEVRKSSSSDLSAMRRALLEVVASGTANTRAEVETYASCTLLYTEMQKKEEKSPEKDSTKSLVQSTLQFLSENEFVSLRPTAPKRGEKKGVEERDALAHEYHATQLGVATVSSALSPEEALVVFAELRIARRSFVLENELHTIYLVTPVYIQAQWPSIDWYSYLRLCEKLPPDMRHVADTLGICESFLARAVQGRVAERTAAQRETLRVHRRFYTALALHDLVHEVPIVAVARKYGVTKGLLQTLQSAAGTFAGMVTVFCNRLGWRNLELLLSQFQSRLMFGVERELCDLVKISLLNGFRARVLYNAGFHTLAAVATANPTTIEICLRNAVPFKSYKLEREEERGEMHTHRPTTWCAKLRRGMSEMEAARAIVQEAQTILSNELNIPTSAWNTATKVLGKPSSNTPAPLRMDVRSDADLTDLTAHNKLYENLPRAQRKSPNAGVEAGMNVKKPRLQETTSSSAKSGTVGTHRPVKSTTSMPSKSKSESRQKVPLAHSDDNVPRLPQATNHPDNTATVPPSPDPEQLPYSRFVSASSVLKNKECEPTSCRPGTTSAQETTAEILSFSPILHSPEVYVESKANSHPPSSPPNPASPRSPDYQLRVQNADGILAASLQNSPLTIPDSLDMSMSFSFQTFAMIDAACNAENDNVYMQECSSPPHSKPPESASPSVGNPNEVNVIKESPLAMRERLSTSKTPNKEPISGREYTSEGIHTATETRKSAQNYQNTFPIASAPNIIAQTPPVVKRVIGRSANAPPPVSETSFSFSQPGLKELSSLCSSQLSQSGITIIDVTANEALFETFVTECLEQKSLSFSIATQSTDQGNGIGSTIVKPREATGILLPRQNEQVMGVAFSWGDVDVYYLSLCQGVAGESGEASIPLLSRVEAVRKIFSEAPLREKLIAYDVKRHAKSLAISCGVLPSRGVLDPKVANWMLDPDAKERTIHRMVLQYLPDQPMLSEEEDGEEMPLSSLATHASDAQMRASAESILAFLLMSKLSTLLEAEGLFEPFAEVEMPSLLVLAKMELNGIGFSPDECEHQKDILQTRLNELEREAYTHAHRTFSLTSPEDVAQVLFIELKLPAPGSEGKQKTLGPSSRKSKRRVPHLSTAKEVLEKIKQLHPLPGIVLEWRRVSSTVTKTVFPLFKDAALHQHIQSVRIHPTCQIHTATGRVATSDPNIQMVPKEYDIGARMGVPRLNLDSASTAINTLMSESQCFDACVTSKEEKAAHGISQPTSSSVCMRNVFVPFPGAVFLAADYSQLELRILAHVSGDEKLRRLLNGEGDVFKMIAGQWLGIPPSEISDKQRQEAKQVCYGMVYGIGAKALGEQLGVLSEDAAQFMESFKSKYPTMKKFISRTIQECKENGHVCTLLGRKRFLPGIHSQNIHAQSQAERQAVNTTIQGSAADLVKTAMVNIDRKLSDHFPDSPLSLAECNRSTRPVAGAHLVLQLHDELLYEVCHNDLMRVAQIVRYEMENALNLSVKFPVKIKVGPSWGKLESFQCT